MAQPHHPLFFQALDLLSLPQRQVAELLHVSHRSLQRYLSTGGPPSGLDFDDFIRTVHARSPDLAEQLAVYHRTTLQALGLQPAVQAPAVPRGPPPPPPARVEHAHSVLWAAAAAGQLSPQTVQPILQAACTRALALGVDLKGLAELLAAPEKPTLPPPP